MPLWAVTTLAAGSRIPLEPGLFDYVVFDEAAATDIASAIPLLFRARAAVVVGDPMQLGLVGGMDAREEGRILARENLKRPGIGGFLQSRTSLFQLAASALDEPPMLLNEHYRCQSRYRRVFQRGVLRQPAGRPDRREPTAGSARDSGRASTGPMSRVPSLRGAGSAWPGPPIPIRRPKLSPGSSESFWKPDSKGSVGVVTFFAPQARRINELATQQLGAGALDRMQVKVFTANRFQGDERDVMLLSLCLAADMPAGARHFLKEERRLLNVAVSRARAVCHIFGNRSHARQCGIPHIETLVPPRRCGGGGPGLRRSTTASRAPGSNGCTRRCWRTASTRCRNTPAGGRFLDLAIVDGDRSPPAASRYRGRRRGVPYRRGRQPSCDGPVARPPVAGPGLESVAVLGA